MSRPSLWNFFRKPLAVTWSGITIEAHWSCWLVVVCILWQLPTGRFHPAFLGLTLMLVVLLHELGHAWACRQAGGQVSKITLWPFGGLAHVRPPQRPWGFFITIAAGPFANLVLAVLLFAVAYATYRLHWTELNLWAREAFAINTIVFVFNLLPIYPLDGARLVQAGLWKMIGRWQAARFAGWIGVACSGVGVIAGLVTLNPWMLGMAVAGAGFSTWESRRAQRMTASLKHVREDFACPECGARPAVGNFWQCSCGTSFDTFALEARCPTCGKEHGVTACPSCGHAHSFSQWWNSTSSSN